MAIYEQGTSLHDIVFCPGDEFVVQGKATISKIIRYFSKGKASPAGIIIDTVGNTIEALNSGIVESHISNYRGYNVLIVRPKDVSVPKINESIEMPAVIADV